MQSKLDGTKRFSKLRVYLLRGRCGFSGTSAPSTEPNRTSGVQTPMALRTEREKGAHLLRRFGLGASEAELDYYLKDGLSGAYDKLLNYENVDENFSFPLEAMQNGNGQVNMPAVQLWWVLRLLITRRPLQEKMTLFWHDHFATSAAKVLGPPLMHGQNELLRQHATGKFYTLLMEASKDPAMLFWLDNQYNVRGKPNENFAREIMELFTLGIGNYSEKDIQEAARAFTGWTIGRPGAGRRPNANQPPPQQVRRNAEFVFRPALHDDGTKELLGNKGNFSGEDVVGILVGNPQTARYLTLKIWEWFAYPDPEPALIDRLATKFRDSGHEIKVLLRSVMESSEFYSDKAERGIYKNPVDYVVSTVRQLGVGEGLGERLKGQETLPRAQILPALSVQQTLKAMGMELLFPPDVAGWEGGASWISSATMVERIQWADRLFGTAGSPNTGGGPRGQRAQIRFPAWTILSADPTPEGAVKTLQSIFDAPLGDKQKPQLLEAATKASDGRVTQANANQTAAAVTRLIFGSPQFQMA